MPEVTRALRGRPTRPTPEGFFRQINSDGTIKAIHDQAAHCANKFGFSTPAQEQRLAERNLPDVISSTATLLTWGLFLRTFADYSLSEKTHSFADYTPDFPRFSGEANDVWRQGAKKRSRKLASLGRHVQKSQSHAEAIAVLLQIAGEPSLKLRTQVGAHLQIVAELLQNTFGASNGLLQIPDPIEAPDHLPHQVSELCASLANVGEPDGHAHQESIHAFELETREFFETVVGGPISLDLNSDRRAKDQPWYFESSYHLASLIFPKLRTPYGRTTWRSIVATHCRPDYQRRYLAKSDYALLRRELLPWLKKDYPKPERRNKALSSK